MRMKFVFVFYLTILIGLAYGNENDRVIINDDNIKNPNRINVAITFSKAKDNLDLQQKFQVCIKSLLKHATIDINFFIIGDAESQALARGFFNEVKDYKIKYDVLSLDVEQLAKKMHEIVSKMQKHFSHSPSSYYGDSLFFISIGLFKILDLNIKRIIMLDADLKFRSDIRLLYEQFDKFQASNVIGIARDGQPVYRHVFWKYRSENPDTRVGSPPPNGLTGFNSGVLMLDLDKMRESKLYQSLILPGSVDKLTEKYSFKGHLGDQDFFSLIGMEHEELFYVLSCTWNRQLCDWWRKHGYEDVFDEYFKCENNDITKVNILHGNCNTPIPEDDDAKIGVFESQQTTTPAPRVIKQEIKKDNNDDDDFDDEDFDDDDDDDDDDDLDLDELLHDAGEL